MTATDSKRTTRQADYVARAKANLVCAGGKRLSVNLTAEGVAALELLAVNGLTQSQAIERALLASAQAARER